MAKIRYYLADLVCSGLPLADLLKPHPLTDIEGLLQGEVPTLGPLSHFDRNSTPSSPSPSTPSSPLQSTPSSPSCGKGDGGHQRHGSPSFHHLCLPWTYITMYMLSKKNNFICIQIKMEYHVFAIFSFIEYISIAICYGKIHVCSIGTLAWSPI